MRAGQLIPLQNDVIAAFLPNALVIGRLYGNVVLKLLKPHIAIYRGAVIQMLKLWYWFRVLWLWIIGDYLCLYVTPVFNGNGLSIDSHVHRVNTRPWHRSLINHSYHRKIRRLVGLNSPLGGDWMFACTLKRQAWKAWNITNYLSNITNLLYTSVCRMLLAVMSS